MGDEAGAGEHERLLLGTRRKGSAWYALVLMLLVIQSVTIVRSPRKGNDIMRDTWT